MLYLNYIDFFYLTKGEIIMKLNKTVILIILLIFSIISLSSCDIYKNIFLNDGGDNGDGGNNGGEVVWGIYTNTYPRLGYEDYIEISFENVEFGDTTETQLTIEGVEYKEEDDFQVNWFNADTTNPFVEIIPLNGWPVMNQTTTLFFNFIDSDNSSIEIPVWVEGIYNVLYVNGNSAGGATADGSINNPYPQIQPAIDSIGESGTGVKSFDNEVVLIYVAEGSYNENVYIDNILLDTNEVSLYGGFSSDFTIKDYNNHTVILNPYDSYSPTITIMQDDTTGKADITQNTVIEGFLINGNTTTGNDSTALSINNASPIIQTNTIDAKGSNSSGNYSTGIKITASSPLITGNVIKGGSNPNAVAIKNEDTSSSEIVNNIIIGNEAASNNYSSYGIENTIDSYAYISNNFIDGGVAEISYGIFNDYCDFDIMNNIIVSSSETAAGEVIGIYDNEDSAMPTTRSIKNNDIWSANNLFINYKTYDGNEESTYIDGLNTLDYASGNVSMEHMLISDSIIEYSGISEQSPNEVKYGGLNLTEYYNYDDEAFDIYGMPRTAEIPSDVTLTNGGDGWSIGPFEYYPAE